MVDQLLTEMRSTARPRHTEPLIQASPSASSRATTSRVRSSSPKETQTWVKTTSLSTSASGIAAIPRANAAAWPAIRSTRSATPCRPSAASTAYTGIDRARRDSSGTFSNGSPAASWIR